MVDCTPPGGCVVDCSPPGGCVVDCTPPGGCVWWTTWVIYDIAGAVITLIELFN